MLRRFDMRRLGLVIAGLEIALSFLIVFLFLGSILGRLKDRSSRM